MNLSLLEVRLERVAGGNKSLNSLLSSGGNGPDAHNGGKFGVSLTNPYKFTF